MEIATVLPLRRHLISKGYSWLTFYQMLKLRRRIGNAVSRLPNYDELAVIPEINTGDLNSLIHLAQKLPKRFM